MKSTAFATLMIGLSAFAAAQSSPHSISLGGTTQYDGWANFTPTNFPGTGNFPGGTPWANPLGSNTAGSGDATLRKTANGTGGGGPFVLSGSIYSGGFSSTPNTFGGSLAVDDTTVVSGLKTVAFQLEIGEAFGYDLYNRVDPVLNYTYIPTGGSPTTASFSSTLFTTRLAHVDTGASFTDPTTGLPQELFNNLYGYQWDLSGVAGTVTGISISFNTVQHSQIYSLQLDQSSQAHGSNVFVAAAVPEPTSLAALGLGAIALVRRRRKA